MSNEVILNLSFDNQTVTDLTGNWTLDGTPNATYEQIEGRDGYSIVEGSLGRCIVLNAVDQNARYDEYTVDFDMFVKSTYTSDYYFYYVFYLWSRTNPNIVGAFEGKIGEVLSISPTIGGSDRYGATNYSPIGRWVHVTITSGPIGEEDLYHTAIYVDGVKLTERTDSGTAHYGNPFGISQRIIPCARDPGSFLMPNGPGVCLNTYKIVAGIHAPNQKPAISLLNLSRVFNNFCTWLKGKLSTVAFTGSYNDLSNKPTISTVNDGTLTIQQNGTNVQTFTANASTNKTANIQCVDLSTAQTISGVKSFSDGLFASKSTAGDLAILEDSSINSTNEDANGMPLTNHTNSLRIKGSQNSVLPLMITAQVAPSGDTSTEFRVYKYKDLNKRAGINIYYTYANDKARAYFTNFDYVLPYASNTTNLGSSSSQWKNTYTSNILIDNDINIASSLINKTSNSGVLTVRGGINDTEGASLSLYGKDYGGSPGLIGNIYMTAYGNSDYTNFRIYPNGIIRVYNNSTATTKNVAMQEDVVNLTSAQTIGGVKTFTSNMVIQGSRKVTCNLDNSFIELDGGTTWGKGGSIVLSGQERSSYTNSVLIVSKSDTNTDILQYQNGELKPLSNNTNNPSLGTSTNQWASVYAQTYYYNGTEFLNKFVTTDTEQSISQVKEFTRTNSDTLRLKNGRVALGETISSDAYTQLVFRDKNTDNLAYIRDIYFTDGSTTLAFYARNKYANGAPSTTGSVSYAYLGIGVDATGKPSASVKGDFTPYSDATYNLGTSTLQWNNAYIKSLTINGVVCGDILTHNASEFVPRSGGAVLSGSFYAKNVDNGALWFMGGTEYNAGANLRLFGKSHSERAGQVELACRRSDGIPVILNLSPDGTATWNGQSIQTTSDQRLKQQITEIDDKLLDAWEDVELSQFKYNDAVKEKSDNARLHTGYVVQQIDKACNEHGVDISKYGLYCHEEYPQETEEVEVEQADGTKTKECKVIREASEHYSLRYTEALIVECAYLRKKLKELTVRIEQLEKGNNVK